MKIIIQEKENDAQSLTKILSEAKSIIVFEYLGLSAKTLTALRKKLHATNARMFVAKNNIYNRAFGLAKLQGFNQLQGPNAILIGGNDEIAPFKELHEIMKTHKFVKYKDGILESNHIPNSELDKIASIPGREGLLSMLLSCLQASIRNLAYGIKAVGEHKPQ
ncbi:MAG: 50S ribosomal protein L10 [Mycoplasmataceae bacterium]|jgi:large subunit ribosomal protein L10|nr:50S ribosomal protein L10 [Mycoplasmataceae bacterium]